VAKPERSLNLALAHLRRPAWPTTLPDFGVTPLPPLVESTLLTADEAVRLQLVRAERSTCALDVERFDAFVAAAAPRTLIIHAVDAEPGVPLLIFWALRNTLAIATFAARAARELGCNILFALPTDLPDALRRALAPLKPVKFVDANYPGGHWRLMPRATRLSPAHALAVDVVAATDWASAVAAGQPAHERPIAVARDQSLEFRTVVRGTRLEEDRGLVARWFAGPRLADQLANPVIADGELTFYRESPGDRSSSTCIRCGACVVICPTHVDPVALLAESVRSLREPSLRRAGLNSCVDCGLCTAACPAGIELHHVIGTLKVARRGRSHV
jgi:ferredoxin